MFSGAQVYQVARSVAHGDGDWAEVPRCVREAIVLALAKGDSPVPPLNHASRAPTSSQPFFDPSSPLPPVLTEGVVQRSVHTFEDAEWMRDQAVRAFAQFHNTVEVLHAAMNSQLSPLLRTAMQLHPDVLANVKEEFNLTRRDAIPDGVALRDSDVASITHQEYILDELASGLRDLRDRSVSLAANFLTDEEKRAMGANPAYLLPDTREEMQRRHALASKPLSSPLKTATKAHTATPTRADKRVSIQEPGPEVESPSRFRSDAYLCELRERYMLRLAQLNEAEEAEKAKQRLTASRAHHERGSHREDPTRIHSRRRLHVSSPDSSSCLSSRSESYTPNERSRESSSSYSSEYAD